MKTRSDKRHRTPQAHEMAAVVGLGLSLPGAVTLEEFWHNIVEKKRFFQSATALDWGAEPELFFQSGEAATDKAYSDRGAFNRCRELENISELQLPDDFDHQSADGSLIFWLNAGRQAASSCRWEAVDPQKVGVISGHVILPSAAMAEAAVTLYTREATRHWSYRPQLPPPPPNAFRLMGYSARLLASSLGFSGPAYTLDAACASSLYALDLSVKALLSGRLQAVITGAVAKADALFTQLGFSQLRALAPSGTLNPFDSRADGLIVGQGAAALVLKRLDKALADGDHIHALIGAVGLSNDVSGNILAPQAEGQLRAMRLAWSGGDLSPAALGLIEAHGTGTIVGDQVEISSLKDLFRDPALALDPRNPPPVLGSVKGNIGHLLSAAGAASLVKVIAALERQTLPPSAGFQKPAPLLHLAEEPALRILTQAESWPEPANGSARLAAVNAFGFGGVNAQVIVRQFRPEDWSSATSRRKSSGPSATAPPPKKAGPVRLLAARALSAPWPDFASLARNWMEPEGPPIIATRRFGSLKATGLFFNSLILEGSGLRLAPKDLAQLLPQQALALKITHEALSCARLKAPHDSAWISALGAADPQSGVAKVKVGVFMGVDIDPRSADYAFRWLGPLKAAEALVAAGELKERDLPDFVQVLREYSHPQLSASRVMGALGSLVASRVARFLGSGGPAFTVSEANLSGLRALRLAMEAIEAGELDLALAGVVDTMGDPKTAALEPKRLWEEGAAMLILASPEAAARLGRAEAPELEELPEAPGRLGGLGGLFPLVKNAFFISHRLASRGLGAGAAYWIKNKSDPPRRLEGAGFVITEKGGEEVSSPPCSYEDATWFLVRSHSRQDSLGLLEKLEQMTLQAASDHQLKEVLGPLRAEKRALKQLGDRFWTEYGQASGARPALALLARSFEDLSSLINRARARLKGEKQTLPPEQKGRIIWALEGERVQGQLAWVFPGSGSHYHGLGRRLAMNFPQIMGRLEDRVSRLADQFQSYVFWGPSPKEVKVIEAILAQVSFGLLGAKVLEQLKIIPQAVLGYSLGETTALVASGAWSDCEALYGDFIKSPLFTSLLAGEHLVARRHLNWPQDKPFHWKTAVVPRPEAAVRQALANLTELHRGRAFLLLVNTPTEAVVGGEESAVKSLAAKLGVTPLYLDSVAAVHNPSVELCRAEYENFHSRPTEAPPGLRFYSAAWGQAYELTRDSAARSLTDQAISGHNFPRLIEQAYADGVRFFVEVGPGAATSRMINAILAGRPHLASSLAPNAHEEGWLGLQRLLVELWMAGYPLKMSMLYPDAQAAAMDLPISIALAPEAEPWPELPKLLEEIQQRQGRGQQPPAPTKDESPKPRPAAPKAATGGQPKASQSLSPAPLSRQLCLEFAVGRVAQVLGPRFAEVDRFPSRVRLPDEPLMLVDRVLSLEGEPLSLGSGRIVTEHDVKAGAWYLEAGHIPAGLAIESGQADLMLSAWLGADFATAGRARYRLLDAEVTFHRELPRAGETARYDIRILRFFKYGQTHLFRFAFEGSIDGRPLMSMKGGCAGFFTPAELAGGRGLPGGGLVEQEAETQVEPAAISLRAQLPESLDEEALTALRQGRLQDCFGADYTPRLEGRALTLPGGRLALIDRVSCLQARGGRYRAGFIRAEMDIDPQAWFLTCHFVGDEVMPGTLMYESCLQALRVFLLALGWIGSEGQVDWQPLPKVAASLKCRGQVTAQNRRAAYEIHIRRLDFIPPPQGGEPEPCALADAVMLADERPIVEVKNLNLRLAGSSRAQLAGLWSGQRPARAEARRKFDKSQLLALAEGRPSLCLGSAYARFDEGAFVARLPRPPYDMLDSVRIIQGEAYELKTGSELEASYRPPAQSWLFTEAGGAKPHLPYAALNEAALQPCGFLAAYMGSALAFEGPMYFRNLGGEAKLLAHPQPADTIVTRASLTRASRMGDMLIEHYRFHSQVRGQTIYEGETHFGFFSPEALARQSGLTLDVQERSEAWPPLKAPFHPYPTGPAWPSGRWRMLDEIALEPLGGPFGLGTVQARGRVRPEAWFFRAHFYQDPVWPGSLGLEAFLQAAKVLAWEKFGRPEPEGLAWASPLAGEPHNWLYRGQIPPGKGEMSLNLAARKVDTKRRELVCDGLVSVDGLPIYRLRGLSVGLKWSAPRRRPAPSSLAEPPAPAEPISPDRLLVWRKEQDLSQGQLAKLMGVTPIYISLMERGKRNISPLMVEKLQLLFASTGSTGELKAPHNAQILAKGTLKSRREEKEAAAKLLTPQRLRQLRLEQGLSQKKLADQVGVTATLIGLIELGKRGLSLSLARKLLAVLEEKDT